MEGGECTHGRWKDGACIADEPMRQGSRGSLGTKKRHSKYGEQVEGSLQTLS